MSSTIPISQYSRSSNSSCSSSNAEEAHLASQSSSDMFQSAVSQPVVGLSPQLLPFASFMQEPSIHLINNGKTMHRMSDGLKSSMTGEGMLESVEIGGEGSEDSVDYSHDKENCRPAMPNSIYLNNGQLDSGKVESHRESAYEPLIDPSELPMLTSTTPNNRKYNDLSFALLFASCNLYMLMMGLYDSIYNWHHPVSSSPSAVFSLMNHGVLTYLCGMFLLAFCLGLVYVWLLKRALRGTVWSSVVMVPLCFSVIGIYGLATASGSSWFVYVVNSVCLLLGFTTGYWLNKNTDSVDKCIQLAEMGLDVLSSYPSLIFVCSVLLLAYLLYVVVWISLFSQVSFSAFNICFYCFMFLWTSATFAYIEKCTISAIVCEWYFHRTNPIKRDMKVWKNDLSLYAIKRSVSLNLGSLCLAAIILAGIRIMRLSANVMKRINRRIGLPESKINRIFTTAIDFIESLTIGLNSYSIVLVAYDGTDFRTASSKSVDMFKRNLFLSSSLAIQTATKIILMLGNYVFALATFTTTSVYIKSHSSTLDLSGSVVVSSLASIVSLWIFQVATGILTQVLDALYVCYMIDTDQGKCNSTQLRDIFQSQTEPADGDQSSRSIRISNPKYRELLL